VRRVLRIELGNFGDHKFVRDGVFELRIDAGSGYRVYYAQEGDLVVLLLCGGDKGLQQRDIDLRRGLLARLPTEDQMTQPYRSHAEATAQMFRRDPAFAADYLDSLLEDGDQADLMVALRHMADAFGGVAKIAEQAQLNPTTLYRTLSRAGNPELKSLSAILGAMGMRIAIQPVKERAT